MSESAHRLGHTVEQLLTLARLDREGLRQVAEIVNLAELVCDMVAFHQPALQDRRIECHLAVPDAPVSVTGLPRLLEQVVANLLDNALHFTPDGGRIAVTLASTVDSVTLTVADSGPGLPETLRNAPVDRFGDLGQRRVGGTGLGLSIAADIARVHGGALTARTSEWGGAQFDLTLPIQRSN